MADEAGVQQHIHKLSEIPVADVSALSFEANSNERGAQFDNRRPLTSRLPMPSDH